MKRPTAKPCKPEMRFFTPELYARFNSPDDELADAANAEWEMASRNYQRHLDALRLRLPAHARNITTLCLHDAEVQSLEPLKEFLSWPLPRPAVLELKHHEANGLLMYWLWDDIREAAAPHDWPFSKDRVHWLYDEVDETDAPEKFVHRILLSDGRVWEIPFVAAYAGGSLRWPGVKSPGAVC